MIAKKHQRRRNGLFAQAIIYSENLSLSCLLGKRVCDIRVQHSHYLLQSQLLLLIEAYILIIIIILVSSHTP